MQLIFALTSKFSGAANSRHTATPLSNIIWGWITLIPEDNPLGLQLDPSELLPSSEHSDVPALNEVILTSLYRKNNLFSSRELRNKENGISIPWLDGK